MLPRSKVRKIKVGLVGRTASTVQIAEVKVHARFKVGAERTALRIYRRVFPGAKWEAIAL